MNVTLISNSQDDVGHGLLEQVAYVARVSNPANQHNDETAERLVRYLITHKHWSPLEMVHACLEIETTRDIARQILRHRSFSFQEFSQRYATVDAMQPAILRECRLQDEHNRQNSLLTDEPDVTKWWLDVQRNTTLMASMMYEQALLRGIAKEQARALLPEGLTPSRMYMAGSLRSWCHYVDVRTDPSTQKEHREVARACADALEPIFPMIKEFCHE